MTGYKQTEIGLIPEDWEVKSLDKVGVFSKGKGISKTESNSGEIPAIRYGELYTKHHNVIRNYYSFINQKVAKESVRLKQGDILFAGSGETKAEIGKSVAFLGSEEVYVGADIVLLSPSTGYNSKFLGYLLNVDFIQKQKASNGQGDAVVHIYANNLKSIQIPLPPLPEQEAIAAALSDADAWVESLEQLIEKKQLLKQAAMQQLLAPKEDWEVKKLGEVCEINSGESPSKFQLNNQGIPYLKVDELNNSTKYTSGIKYFVNTDKIIKAGSIIFPKRGASIFLNKIRILSTDSFMDTNLMTLSINSDYNNEFLYYSLIHFGLDKIADTTSIPQINNKHIIPLEVQFPSLSEQTRIATILSDMDAEIEALENQLAKASQIKQGMMQELLTGRIRLLATSV